MTQDTEKALEIIEPMAKALNIEVSADNRFLYCNDQAIGISANSTFATLMEFIGYVMVTVYQKDFRMCDKLPRKYEREVIRRYWFSREQMKVFNQMPGAAPQAPAREPAYVMALEEIRHIMPFTVWVEDLDTGAQLLHVALIEGEYRDSSGDWSIDVNAASTSEFYGYRWRMWNKKPTQEERQKTKWRGQ